MARDLQQQLRRADQLRVHPDERQADRAAELAAGRQRQLHPEQEHVPDEPGGQDHDPDVRRDDQGRCALEAVETDHTTGKSGFMIASGANGFMHTDPFSCDGTGSTSSRSTTRRGRNIPPWGVGAYMINDPVRDRPFEACTSVEQARDRQDHQDDQRPVLQGVLGSVRDDKDNPKLEPDDAPCYQEGRHPRRLARRAEQGNRLRRSSTTRSATWTSTARRTTRTGPSHCSSTRATRSRRRSCKASRRRPTGTSTRRSSSSPTSATPSSTPSATCPPVTAASAAEGTRQLLPVLHAGEGQRRLRVGVRQHEQRQHVQPRPGDPDGTVRQGRPRHARRLRQRGPAQPSLQVAS